jgi:hypothetical protein
MSFVNWVIDSLASEDVIDIYFILSDLVDIDLTAEELCETAYFDALATATVNEYNGDRVPLGKLVL